MDSQTGETTAAVPDFTAQIDHLPAFSVDPPGVLVLTRHWTREDAWLIVKKADPEVTFSDELLTDLLSGGDNRGMYPGMSIVAPEDHPMETPWVRHHDHDHYIEDMCDKPDQCFTNWVLHIRARDRHVVYRIGEYELRGNRWRARWPD